MKITHRVIGDCCIWEGISLMKLCVELFSFLLFVILTENKVLADSLSYDFVLRILDSHIFTRSSPFALLNLFVQFPSRLLAGNTSIHGPIHVPYCY